MRDSEPVGLLKRADASLKMAVSVHSLTKEEEPEILHIDKCLNYDVVILLETMVSEITLNRYTTSDDCRKTAELSVDAAKARKVLAGLIRQGITFSGRRKLAVLQNWLYMVSKKTENVIFSIPLSVNGRNEYVVHYRKNTGTDVRISQLSLKGSMAESGKLKTEHNYMICLEENGVRIKRQDREIFGHETRWHTYPPDKFETLGKLTFIYKVDRA
ncbi:hypothetical protein LGE20_004717 [Salmonella enterica]|nr:hypothetical protein [Salmonella enterica]EIG9537047.1 hypothetical protein [Salmonella enterica]EIH0809704.1 hypothetical protein [Salmonella enterica]EIH2228456.1 hypothetical protein [Salmonella enterica]EIH3860543.1 hypothetical protein [Salmonella enterica]